MTRKDVHWEDSGFDCDHCGGEILKRSHRSIPEKEQYFQCNQCGCRWSVGGDVLRVGNGPACQQTMVQQQPSLLVDKRIWWAAAIVALLLIFVRFGGAAVFGVAFTLVRFLIPLGILILIGMAIYWLGRQQGFWR